MSDELLFADEETSDEKLSSEGSWKILIVDDEASVHDVTKLALKNFVFDDRGLEFISAYSGKEAIKILHETGDIALILLDVVMETDTAGLVVVDSIRNDLDNDSIRIILRTGQPGAAPEKEVIDSYDINDYKEKTELTSIKLYTVVRNSLKAYKNICELKEYSSNLEERIEDEVQKSREKDKMVINQSRHAAIGDMLNMIAHQWRQPLTVISMAINNVSMDIEEDIIDSKTINRSLAEVNNIIQDLSKKIDEFGTFFEPKKDKESFLPSDIIDKLLVFIESTLIKHKVDIKKEYNSSAKLTTYKKEFVLAVLNIIKNASDVLAKRKTKNPAIKIKINEDSDNCNIEISDNGGGVEDNIKNYIFDPYFSTKYEKNDKGLGLYISKTIVEKQLNGKISFTNNDEGACFSIAVPL